VSILYALGCLTMEGPARRNSGKLSSNQPVLRFLRKGAVSVFSSEPDTGSRQETRQSRNLALRFDFIGTEWL
jgi:hypothetical protein